MILFHQIFDKSLLEMSTNSSPPHKGEKKGEVKRKRQSTCRKICFPLRCFKSYCCCCFCCVKCKKRCKRSIWFITVVLFALIIPNLLGYYYFDEEIEQTRSHNQPTKDLDFTLWLSVLLQQWLVITNKPHTNNISNTITF